MRLQRAWRRSRAVRNDKDPLTHDPVPVGARRLVLVESEGVAYKFDGPTLAASALCSGSFEHPVLRRELTAPEVRRLGWAAGLGRFGREALRVSFEHRGGIAKHAAELCSLVSFLEGEAGAALNRALEQAEFFGSPDGDDGDSGVTAYSDALDSMVLTRPCAVRPVVEMHKAIVAGRSTAWHDVKEDLYDVMTDAMRDAEDCLRRAVRQGRPRPLTALGEWLAAPLL